MRRNPSNFLYVIEIIQSMTDGQSLFVILTLMPNTIHVGKALEIKGLAKEEKIKMSSFYTEDDRKLVGEPVNKSMAKKILQPLSLPPTSLHV